MEKTIEKTCRYLVASDLHLERVPSHSSHALNFDQDLADMLAHHGCLAPGSISWKLIFNGDFIEFDDLEQPENLSLVESRRRETGLLGFDHIPEGDWRTPARKLNAILASHALLLKTLAAFLAQGHEIIFIRGNHDLELCWGPVQEELRLLIASGCPAGLAAGSMDRLVRENIRFVPWFYFEPGLLYIEHGNQYDEYASNAHNLYPFSLGDKPRVELPLASLYMRYFSSRIEGHNPDILAKRRALFPYLGCLVRSNWMNLPKIPLYYVQVVYQALNQLRNRDGLRLSMTEEIERRMLQDIQRSSGLSYRTLLALRALAQSPALDGWIHWIRCSFLDLTLGLLLNLSVAVALLIFGHELEQFHLLVSTCALLAALSVSRGKQRAKTAVAHSRFKDIARRIAALTGARYIVFGHSHQTDIASWRLPRRQEATYLNLGCWAPFEANCFCYLLIDPLKKSRTGLMRWDARSRQPATLSATPSPVPQAKATLRRLFHKNSGR
ncbi:MAG: hypothetical protein HY549_02035 [Elusimicrobia bacterium]|nr:hypothetical protein [Elusimicrobiota bacterium]